MLPHSPELGRRAAFALAGAAAARFARAQQALPSLQMEAKRAGLRYGSDSDEVVESAPPAYVELFRQQCSMIAPMFLWMRSQPRPDGPDLQWEDPNIGFARRAGLQLTGGHFLWHLSLPPWFASLRGPAEAEKAITDHITALARTYKGFAWSWNVVNEAIDTRNGTSEGMRQSPFQARFGETYFDIAYHAARAADPTALLTYNDDLFEMNSPIFEQRRRALIALLDRLVARKVPIDAVGLQGHIRLNGPRFDQEIYRRFLQEIADRGLKIVITELDVFENTRRDVAARDADVASMYSSFLGVALDQKAVVSLVTWGLSDRYTWLTPERSPDLHLPSGSPARPLPFDEDFQPKPAFNAIVAALRAAPMRPAWRRA